MIRSPINTAVATFLILGATSVRAEIIHVNIANQNPNYDSNFGGLSFDLNTAATTDTIGTGSCGNTSGVYTSFHTTGGVSNASLIWNGVDYSLQSANFNLDPQDLPNSCIFDLNMSLTFNNGTTFLAEDQPAGGPFLYSEYNPSQMLAAAVLATYNHQLTAPLLEVDGQYPGDTGFVASATPVPEPGTPVLLAIGLAGIAVSRRRLKA
jgi:hypothetical protein